ncbi:MAG TPA: DUF2298 domain-containing protein [Anaerolineaceae bacterium]|nr:DUF2298 domain-containing protein [Anaerolineaceae bacterium]
MIGLHLVNRNQPLFNFESSRVQVSPSVSADLLLPADRQQELRDGGTWAELFPPTALQNRSEIAAVVLWWLFLLALGWLIYPLLHKALPGLRDFGYPFARVAGLLLLSYPVWLLGSLQLPVTRGLIALVLGGLALISIAVAWGNRRSFGEHLRQRRRYFFQIELIALVAFMAFLLVRWGNPDLWHVYFGGEKPMDFSYFNAVLKSETFPPYDPWFAGGVMNYYYYGFVLVGIPVKLLGITPAVAYNLILPSLFSLVFMGAFSIGWNLNQKRPWIAGIGAGLAIVVFGNLGAVRMVWDGWQKLVAPETVITSATFFEKIQLAFAGASRWIQGAALPYFPGDWYWIPSRAVIPAPNYEITEFPLFSFLYADPHAHLISLSITLLVIAWSLSAVLCRAQWGNIPQSIWALALGALAVGILRAANSWDHPTYLIFSSQMDRTKTNTPQCTR